MANPKNCAPIQQGAVRYVNLYRDADGTVSSNATHDDLLAAKRCIRHDGTYLCTIKVTTKTEVA